MSIARRTALERSLKPLPIIIEGRKVYPPSEAAEILTQRAGRKITVGILRQLRNKGRIQGTRYGYNETVYTEEQLRQADLKQYKAGRPKKSA
jgi:hypothetical protein